LSLLKRLMVSLYAPRPARQFFIRQTRPAQHWVTAGSQADAVSCERFVIRNIYMKSLGAFKSLKTEGGVDTERRTPRQLAKVHESAKHQVAISAHFQAWSPLSLRFWMPGLDDSGCSRTRRTNQDLVQVLQKTYFRHEGP
jgi:hypothetical protein